MTERYQKLIKWAQIHEPRWLYIVEVISVSKTIMEQSVGLIKANSKGELLLARLLDKGDYFCNWAEAIIDIKIEDLNISKTYETEYIFTQKLWREPVKKVDKGIIVFKPIIFNEEQILKL